MDRLKTHFSQVNCVLRMTCLLGTLMVFVGACNAGPREQASTQEPAAPSPTTLVVETPQKEEPGFFCETEHYHPVDQAAWTLIDSLKQAGITDLLFMRHWLFANGYNGYGKVFWMQEGQCHQRWLYLPLVGVDYKVIPLNSPATCSNDPMELYASQWMDAKADPLEEPLIRVSHPARYFVYRLQNDTETCFEVTGPELDANPEHPKQTFINALAIPLEEYTKWSTR